VIAAQPAVLAAVHWHDPPALTANEPLAASFERPTEDGDSAIVHGSVVAASCRTATAWPATVSEPVRTSAAAFAVTDTPTVPGPAPLAPLATVIQPRSDAAVHAQAAAVVTVTAALPADDPNESADGATENVHAAGGVGPVGDFSLQAHWMTTAAVMAKKTPARRMLLGRMLTPS